MRKIYEKNKNISIWDRIYSEKLPGSNMQYPCSNLVAIFHQNKSNIRTGSCLDHGFGAANNSAFLINFFDNLYGTEISNSCLEIADKKLNKLLKYNKSNFIKTDTLESFKNQFDVIVSWGVLGYNSRESIQESIYQLFNALQNGGVLFATIPSIRDSKANLKIEGGNNEYVIQSDIPHQEGAELYAADVECDFIELFERFEVLDFGSFERKSIIQNVTFAENYVVALKK